MLGVAPGVIRPPPQHGQWVAGLVVYVVAITDAHDVMPWAPIHIGDDWSQAADNIRSPYS